MNQLVPETSAKVEFNYSTDKSQKRPTLPVESKMGLKTFPNKRFQKIKKYFSPNLKISLVEFMVEF